MAFDGRLFIALMISLALIPGACAITMGGGVLASVDADSSAQGNFVADNTGVGSVVSSFGSVPHVGELRYVQDKSGKRAEMSFNVINAVGDVGYSAIFFPKEGISSVTAAQVSARQTLKVSKADSIALRCAAQSARGSNVVDVELTASKIDSPASPASFSGSTLSQAGTISALASIQGRAVGAIHGTASYGGSAITGPYTATRTRDSGGNKVDCTLTMQASSNKGIGAMGSASKFNVYSAQNEKIQSAVDAAWDGDSINIAQGTYKENIVVDKSLTIKGEGAATTIVDGGQSGSVFVLGPNNPKINTALSGITILGGSGTLTDVGGGQMSLCGGGIWNRGTLTLSSTKIYGNTATYGGGMWNAGTVNLNSATAIYGNQANIGGGVCNSAGSLTLKGASISYNKAIKGTQLYDGIGGGIANFQGTVNLISGSVYSNTAATTGGGIFYKGGKFTGQGSIVHSNTPNQIASA